VLDYDFEQSIFYWIGMTFRTFERVLNEELEPHGITYRQWQVLGWLALEGELSQSQLVERLQIEAPTLAGILDRMERDGWISRRVDDGDRRKKLVRPTPRVRPVWAKIVAAARRVRAQATQAILPEQLEIVRQTLAAIQENLKAAQPIDKVVS
jgi:MarR family transcriptional regulator for hemolysin